MVPATLSGSGPLPKKALRARVKRGDTHLHMPCRASAAERDADQSLLDARPKGLTGDELEEAVAEIKARREKELSEARPQAADLSTGVKYARVWRGGKDFAYVCARLCS